MKEEKIKVLALLPMELPKEIELDNTLEAMQKFVGGLIEWIIFCSLKALVSLCIRTHMEIGCIDDRSGCDKG